MSRKIRVEDSNASVLGHLPKLHVAYRLSGRLRYGFLAPDRSRHKAMLAVGLAAYDVATGWLLNRSEAMPLYPLRVGADVVDIMVWAATADESFTDFVNVANVTAAESGIRLGLAGMVVPMVQSAAVAVARRAAGKPQRLDAFAWGFVAAGVGWGLAAYERQRRTQLRSSRSVEIAARSERARLAGQHSVAMGADPIVDLLVRTTPLLAIVGQVHQDPLHVWKARLAEQARTSATYLADAMLAWAADHNRRTPLLSETVDVVIAVGSDQLLLTRAQAVALRHGLDRAGFRGRLNIACRIGASGHRPGGALNVVVNESTTIEVPADRLQAPSPLDPAPLAVGLMAAQFLMQSNPAYEAAPLSRTLPGVILAAASALALYRRLSRGAPDVCAEALVLSHALAFGHTLLVTPAQRNDYAPDGFQLLPAALALTGPSVLAALYWPRLTPVPRVLVVSAFAATLATGVLMRPWPIGFRSFAAALGFFAITIGPASGWGEVLARQATAVGDEIERAATDQELAAFALGRQQVIDLVTTAVNQARKTLDETWNDLDTGLAFTAAARLAELDVRLSRLG